MGCKSPLDSLLCRVDKHLLHSYDSYDSTNFYMESLANKTNQKISKSP